MIGSSSLTGSLIKNGSCHKSCIGVVAGEDRMTARGTKFIDSLCSTTLKMIQSDFEPCLTFQIEELNSVWSQSFIFL